MGLSLDGLRKSAYVEGGRRQETERTGRKRVSYGVVRDCRTDLRGS